MSLKERLKMAVASQAEIEADEERQDAHRSVGCTPVDQLSNRSRASVSGVIRSVTLRPREGVPALEAELYDGSALITLIWLGRRRIAGIEPGRAIKVIGRVGRQDNMRVMYNPRYELLPSASTS